MLKALPYLVAAMVALGSIIQGLNAFYEYVYKSGVAGCELAAKNQETETLNRIASYVAEQQSKQEQIEDIIRNDKDNSKISAPVLIRHLNSVSESCAGKTSC